AFLDAVRFTGYSPGALRLASGEIVPPNAPPTPATLGGANRPSDTQFQFTISGAVVGRSYTAQFSTNLTDWISLATFTANANQFIFQDIYATNSLGFYRLLSNP